MRQIELLRFAIEALERLVIPYAVVGSYASGAWGEPRMTRDIDIVVSLAADRVNQLCDAFPENDFYVSRVAAAEAASAGHQFNVIHLSSGNKIDFMVAGKTTWQAGQLARRRKAELSPNLYGYVAAPEDVILGKLVYYDEGGSEKHLRDITGIISISGDQLDRKYLDHWVAELGVVDGWQKVLAKCDEHS